MEGLHYDSFFNRLKDAQIGAVRVVFKGDKIMIRVPLKQNMSREELQNEKNDIITKVKEHFPDYKVESVNRN